MRPRGLQTSVFVSSICMWSISDFSLNKFGFNRKLLALWRLIKLCTWCFSFEPGDDDHHFSSSKLQTESQPLKVPGSVKRKQILSPSLEKSTRSHLSLQDVRSGNAALYGLLPYTRSWTRTLWLECVPLHLYDHSIWSVYAAFLQWNRGTIRL